jgi:hypothetical protein
MKGPADSAVRIGGPFSTLNPEQSLMEHTASIYFHNVSDVCRPTSSLGPSVPFVPFPVNKLLGCQSRSNRSCSSWRSSIIG